MYWPAYATTTYIFNSRRALGCSQEGWGVSQGTLPMPQLMLPALMHNCPISLWQVIGYGMSVELINMLLISR